MNYYNKHFSIDDNEIFIIDGNINTHYWISEGVVLGRCLQGMGYVYELTQKQLADILDKADTMSLVINTIIYVPKEDRESDMTSD